MTYKKSYENKWKLDLEDTEVSDNQRKGMVYTGITFISQITFKYFISALSRTTHLKQIENNKQLDKNTNSLLESLWILTGSSSTQQSSLFHWCHLLIQLITNYTTPTKTPFSN